MPETWVRVSTGSNSSKLIVQVSKELYIYFSGKGIFAQSPKNAIRRLSVTTQKITN